MNLSTRLGRATLITAIITATSVFAASTAADAHVSIIPGVSATGSTTTALTAGQSGYLNFRIGHGCTDETGTLNPITGLSMSGTNWNTHTVAVEVPVIAQGTGTTIPKAQYIPGWRATVTKNADTGAYLVKWTAVSSDFDVPDAPEGGAGGKQYADFGLSMKWNAAALGDVYFKAYQTCNVDMSTKPAVASANPISLKRNRTGAIATINAGKALAASKITFYGENGYTHEATVGADGKASIWIKALHYRAIVNDKKFFGVKDANANILGYLGGTVASRQISVAWDVTDGSGKDVVLDDVEHNTAPKVTVLAAN